MNTPQAKPEISPNIESQEFHPDFQVSDVSIHPSIVFLHDLYSPQIPIMFFWCVKRTGPFCPIILNFANSCYFLEGAVLTLSLPAKMTSPNPKKWIQGENSKKNMIETTTLEPL